MFHVKDLLVKVRMLVMLRYYIYGSLHFKRIIHPNIGCIIKKRFSRENSYYIFSFAITVAFGLLINIILYFVANIVSDSSDTETK